MIQACTDTWLDFVRIDVEPKYSVAVIAVAGGYPATYVNGEEIQIRQTNEATVFHAGTTLSASGQLKTAGGRVLAATSTGSTLSEAIEKAYNGMKAVSYKDMHFRKDIGQRFLNNAPFSSSPDKLNGEPLTYASAGVSIDAGNSLVKSIKTIIKSTARPGASADIGAFGALFDLFEAGYSAPPQLVLGIDGVGTKLHIAHAMNKHDTVGIDLVAMNV